ncbi:MAG: hypothetical protein JW969_07320 [Spirochaetales bacterium]|nr:hypothetical protein [Spirochaetales bacterium]
MKIRKYLFFLFALIYIFLLCPHNFTHAQSENKIKELSVAAVQFAVNLDIYSSSNLFEKEINNLFEKEIKSIIDSTTEKKPIDLIVFPEYTLAFLAFIPNGKDLENSPTFEQAFTSIKNKYPIFKTINGFFLTRARYTLIQAKRIFGKLSQKYHCYILAGSYFARSVGNTLVNRALVFGPSGSIIYTQDKVFLTNFEKDILKLSPGNQKKCKGFFINNLHVALTICRDTFDSSWESVYNQYDLWIDIKANGTYFTEQEKVSFERALPARMKKTSVPYGITACLTGSLFDLLWEGESSIIHNNKGIIQYLFKTGPIAEGVLKAELTFH